jgi:hypothetical protein
MLIVDKNKNIEAIPCTFVTKMHMNRDIKLLALPALDRFFAERCPNPILDGGVLCLAQFVLAGVRLVFCLNVIDEYIDNAE